MGARDQGFRQYAVGLEWSLLDRSKQRRECALNMLLLLLLLLLFSFEIEHGPLRQVSAVL